VNFAAGVVISLQTDNHASISPLSFYRPGVLPAAQPKAVKAGQDKSRVIFMNTQKRSKTKARINFESDKLLTKFIMQKWAVVKKNDANKSLEFLYCLLFEGWGMK